MTPEMIDLARRNAAKSGLANVEFHLATIDRLPLADDSVDCVISNCVINLATDKPAVLAGDRPSAQARRPAGRQRHRAQADRCRRRSRRDLMAYVGCIAGAILIDDYRRMLLEAGFAQVEIIDSRKDLNAYAKVENQSACCGPDTVSTPAGLPVTQASCCGGAETAPGDSALHSSLAELLRRYNVNEFAASVRVFAVKPG